MLYAGQMVVQATGPLDSPHMASDTAFLEREYNARAAIRDHPQIFARWAEQGAAARRMHAA